MQQHMQLWSKAKYYLNEGFNWLEFMANGVARIGLKERINLQMLLVLILTRLAMINLIVLVDRMTKIVQTRKDAAQKPIGNWLLQLFDMQTIQSTNCFAQGSQQKRLQSRLELLQHH